MRARIYGNAAARQKAFRARQAARLTGLQKTVSKKPQRPPSRPTRLATLTNGIQLLQTEYESWLESLPDSMTDSDTAERLQEAIDQLQAAADILEAIELPRGFGRD